MYELDILLAFLEDRQLGQVMVYVSTVYILTLHLISYKALGLHTYTALKPYDAK